MVTCSKCDTTKKFSNDVKEYFMEGITMTNVTGKKLFLLGSHKNHVIYNTDGSLSSYFDGVTRSQGTLVWSFNHIEGETGCVPASASGDWDDTLLCDDSVTVRGVMFTNIMPVNNFKHTAIKVKLADADPLDFTSLTSEFGGKEPMGSKKYGYSLPYITGRTYAVWWHDGLDFDHLAMDITEMAEDTE